MELRCKHQRLAVGTYTFYAVATDAKGVSSAVYSTTLTVAAKVNPITISSLSCSVAYLNGYDYVTLTVKVSVAAGQPAPTGIVTFYLYGSASVTEISQRPAGEPRQR